MTLAYIPSPPEGVWYLGPLPIRGYALCILLGVVVAIWYGSHRWVQRGGRPGTVMDIAVWAVPFGLVGARLYHVITDPELYFLPGRDPWHAFFIWDGGLGIWGAIALGALGAYLGCRRYGVRFTALADALAPAIAIAQAIGRWGNYFNQELYGRPTTLPWGLEISPAHREPGYQQYATYHPTFLYECIWDLGVAGLVLWADRRFKLGYGRAFALYVMAYTVGRGWIEYMRIDTANHFFGLRLNDWTCMFVFLGGLVYFLVSRRRHPGREQVVQVWDESAEAAEPAAEGADPLGGESEVRGGGAEVGAASHDRAGPDVEAAGPP
ncbi:MAG TPA: prolipoprotein diacylglyceryl transferase [Nocardioidaceae bacterium]|nr:prolipoprotein diacylglyceryl transferase [Nocardioidaceae bacterium]